MPQVGYQLDAQAGLNPASGLFFNDGEDGDFRGRTENVFDRALMATATRRGLMGVDVALPEAGQVFRFRSSGAGSSIRIDAKSRGLGQGAKWVVFLVLLVGGAVFAYGVTQALARR